MDVKKIIEEKTKMDAEDVKPDVPKLNMTLDKFKSELLRLHQKGREATLMHRAKMPISHNKKKDKRLGNHPPGTDYENCEICKQIIDCHNNFMQLQSDAFGITGIPYDNLMASIKITEGILKLQKNDMANTN